MLLSPKSSSTKRANAIDDRELPSTVECRSSAAGRLGVDCRRKCAALQPVRRLGRVVLRRLEEHGLEVEVALDAAQHVVSYSLRPTIARRPCDASDSTEK